jgi:hypothetical protein
MIISMEKETGIEIRLEKLLQGNRLLLSDIVLLQYLKSGVRLSRKIRRQTGVLNMHYQTMQLLLFYLEMIQDFIQEIGSRVLTDLFLCI